MSEPRPAPSRPFHAGRVALAVGVGLLLVLVLGVFDVNRGVRELLAQVDALGWAAPPLFVLLHAAAVVALVPGILFPLGAGLLFGVLYGTVYSTLGKLLGACLAFLISRYLLARGVLPERARHWRQRHPKIRKLEKELPEGGWTAVLLIRLVPIVPFKLSNYVFGWTRFRLRDFALGTLLGALPFSLINAYLGSLGADLASLGARSEPRTTIAWIAFATGGLLSVAAAIAITRIAIRILRSAEAKT